MAKNPTAAVSGNAGATMAPKPAGAPAPEGELERAIRTKFGGVDTHRPTFADQKSYPVYNELATDGERTITMPGTDGRTHAYTWKTHHDPIPVPFEHALRLANIPGFKVLNELGMVIQPRRASSDRINVGLAPHETVAQLVELTDEALVNRANKAAQGDQKLLDAIGKAPREEIIEMLMGLPDQGTGAATVPAAASEAAPKTGGGTQVEDDPDFVGANT